MLTIDPWKTKNGGQLKGPVLAKRWRADGSIVGYDRAKYFSVKEHVVRDIRELSGLLTTLEHEPHSCVVRGAWRHCSDLPEPATRQRTTRDLDHFDEVPRRWICLDVDGWEVAAGLDPINEPQAAIAEFIRAALPEEFQHVTCHWQLSNSAGKPGSGRTLKAHLWFWLKKAHSGSHLERWVRDCKLPVDPTVFRTVQIHYTAAPVVEPGASCPVKVRSGLIEGIFDDEVDLVLPPPDEGSAGHRGSARALMKDPRRKGGIHGAFCRAYPPARVIEEDLCEGAFEWEDHSDTRVSWMAGDHSPGGVCITDDGLRFYNSHASDPFEGRAVNAWDFVRQHRFGHLDDRVDPDAVDWMRQNGGMPSEVAMRDFARGLDDVAEALEEERSLRVNGDAQAPLAASATRGQSLVPHEARKGSELRVYSVGELLELPTPGFLVKGILPQKGLAMLYGESGSGKTFVAIDIICSIALGRDWRGQRVRTGGVVYVAAEAQHSIGLRFKAYAQHHGVDLDNAPIGIVPQTINLTDGHVDRDRLIEACHAMRERGFAVELIVIDTLNRVMGGADENASDAMGCLINQVDTIREATGATVLIVHHAGKDLSRGARGHSSLRAAVDTELEVTRSNGGRMLRVTKNRDGEDGGRHAVELKVIELGIDDDLDPITSCVAVEPSGQVATVIQRPSGKWQVAVFDVVSEAGEDGIAADDVPGLAVRRITPVPRRGVESARRAQADLVRRRILIEERGRLYLPPELLAA